MTRLVRRSAKEAEDKTHGSTGTGSTRLMAGACISVVGAQTVSGTSSALVLQR